MSRIGRRPIKLPAKVKVELKERSVVVEGPLGRLEGIVLPGVVLRQEGDVIHVQAPSLNRQNRGFQGLMRALLFNMVHGVVQGYQESLEIQGVGFKAELKGTVLVIAAGYSHLVHLQVPAGIEVKIDKSQTKLQIVGINKALVGLFTAKIHNVKKPEPYKGKGIRYVNRPDKPVRRKDGKTGAK